MNAILFSKLNGAIKLDLTATLQLALVANEVDAHVLIRVLLDLLQPAAQILESLVARDVVRQEDAVGAAVEYPRH